MAKRAHKRRLAADGGLKVDILEEDGSITPAEEPAPVPIDAAPEEPTEPDSLTLDTRRDKQAAAVDQPPQVQATDATPASVQPTAPEEERELIVDGKRVRVPLSKILDAGTRTIQKESAADMRLAAATELLRSAQERQAQPPAPVVAQPSDDDAALARSIQFGTEDEAKAAIARIRNATPAITPQQIEAYVQQTLAQRLPDHTAFHDANAWLRTEYSAITSDPDLKTMFDMKEDQARKAGDRRPYKELYADLAGQMATKFNLKRADQPTAAQPMQTADRLTRKAASPRPITGASGRVEQAPQPQKPLTVAEYVSQQRQRRGLQPLEKQGA
jgi:hypothetical protein